LAFLKAEFLPNWTWSGLDVATPGWRREFDETRAGLCSAHLATSGNLGDVSRRIEVQMSQMCMVTRVAEYHLDNPSHELQGIAEM